MAQLATVLSAVVGRPVVDRSGLAGFYRLNLLFAAVHPGLAALPSNGQVPSSGGQVPLPASGRIQLPSLFTVVQEALGMKLEPRDELIEVLVIDEATYPTPN
jgi:uncharacterized protein (TIGR03435 family)